MTQSDTDQYELHVLGTPELRAPDGHRVSSVLSQPRRLGLLTYLALAPGPVSRSTIVADFWPESDEDQARNNLSQAVYYLRRSLDEDVVRSVEGDRLWAPPERLWCDARELLSDDGTAVELLETASEGELLAGWNADDSHPLQEWLDGQRRRVRARAEELSRTIASEPEPAEPRPHPVDPVDGEPPSTVGSRRRLAWVAAFGGLVAAVVLAAAWLGRPAPAADAPPEPQDLAVLMPSVTVAPGAPSMAEQAILDEVLAELGRTGRLRVVEASYAASIQELVRLLPRLDAPDRDVADWILAVSVRVSEQESRVVGILYASPRLEVVGRAAFDVSHATPDAIMIETPQEIATRVATMVVEAVGAEPREEP